MMERRWIIDKSLDFCYGHRVWSQELDREYSVDGCLMCRHLHGHQGKIKIFVSSSELERGMVTDFKHLDWFKVWLDATLDHKFIIDRRDPLFFDMMSHYCDGEGGMDERLFNHLPQGCWIPDISHLPKEAPDALVEKYEGMVVVDFVPTSENLTSWIMDIVSSRMSALDIEVEAIEFWETPKSHCRVEKV